jgi:hypothetical protein
MSISQISSNITKSSNAIEIYRGESKDLELEVTQVVENAEGNDEEQPVNFTGAVIYLTVRATASSPDALISKDSTNALDIEILIPETDGLALIHLSPDDTKNMEAEKYVFDVWIVLSSGKQVPVVEVSEFIVKEPVTKLP